MYLFSLESGSHGPCASHWSDPTRTVRAIFETASFRQSLLLTFFVFSVYRLLMNDSMEVRLVGLQDAKAAIGKGSLEKLNPEEKRKARLTALKDLFEVEEVNQSWVNC